jgi:hypothetical protein
MRVIMYIEPVYISLVSPSRCRRNQITHTTEAAPEDDEVWCQEDLGFGCL